MLKMLLLSVFGGLLFSSCIDVKKAVYFNNVRDTVFNDVATSDLLPVIQKNDLLSITVSSLNPEATLIFNTPNVSPVSTSNLLSGQTQMVGYLVNQDGEINFPVLGEVRAAGLTKKQLTDQLAKMLTDKKLLVDPIITIRFLNFRVTVLGEVARPTVITVPSEKISILEALGMAGDLTIYAKRDNVLLIREEKGQKITKRINLNATDILSSPYYYLKTNDIVYAEPNQARVSATSELRQNLPIILSALSFLTIIFSYVVRRN